MFKKPQLPEPVLNKLDGIEAAADAAAALIDSQSDTVRIAALEQRLALFEPMMEQLAANAKLGAKLAEYLDDLREEQVFFNKARWAVGGATAIVLIALILILILAIFCSSSPLLSAPPIAIATFMIGLVSGIVLLLNGFVKSVFRSTAERHSDGFLPPALEKTIEIFEKVTGKS